MIEIMDLQLLTNDILAERLLTQFNSKRYVEWAENLMQLGYESENLFILAGLDNEYSDIRENYFWKTIKDLKIKVNKSEEELIENFAISIAEKVINKQINIDFAFNIMIRIVYKTNYNSRYLDFFIIDEDLDNFYYNKISESPDGLNFDNKDDYIKNEFSIFLQMEKLNIPIDERKLCYCEKCKKLMEPKLKTKYQIKSPFKYNVWCCYYCNSENIKFNGNQEVKKMIIENFKNKS